MGRSISKDMAVDRAIKITDDSRVYLSPWSMLLQWKRIIKRNQTLCVNFLLMTIGAGMNKTDLMGVRQFLRAVLLITSQFTLAFVVLDNA